MSTTVTSKGQVTIPKAIRDYLGIKPGMAVDFVAGQDGQIILRTAQPVVREPDRFDRVRGTLKTNLTTDEIMAFLRGDD